MKPIPPPTPTRRIYGKDPETGETYYHLGRIEKAMFWVGLAILYIAHAITIGVIAIIMYK